MTKCVLCLTEHDNVWGGDPNMYCERCISIREAARGTTSHIVDTLYLSDMKAAGGFVGARMCVHEDGPKYSGYCHFVPILTKKPNSKWDRTGAVASLKALTKACDIIHRHIESGENILVHCQGGIERSPLTVAWYLTMKKKQFSTLQEAYEFLKSKRPAVSERLFWL